MSEHSHPDHACRPSELVSMRYYEDVWQLSEPAAIHAKEPFSFVDRTQHWRQEDVRAMLALASIVQSLYQSGTLNILQSF
jgi:hypothetical protein